MNFEELLGDLSPALGFFPPSLLALPLLIASVRAWTLLRKGRTWSAWGGGLTAILALWLMFVGVLLYSCFSQGCQREILVITLFGIVISGGTALIEAVVFSVLFVGLRLVHAWRFSSAPSVN